LIVAVRDEYILVIINPFLGFPLHEPLSDKTDAGVHVLWWLLNLNPATAWSIPKKKLESCDLLWQQATASVARKGLNFDAESIG